LIANDDLHPSELQYAQWVKLLLNDDLGTILSDLSDEPLIIYPNSVTDKVTISYSVKVDKTIEIYNNTGNLVLKQEMNTETADLSLKDLSQGIYTIRLIYKGGQVSKKIIKE
jgi:hypothetical protein